MCTFGVESTLLPNTHVSLLNFNPNRPIIFNEGRQPSIIRVGAVPGGMGDDTTDAAAIELPSDADMEERGDEPTTCGCELASFGDSALSASAADHRSEPRG
jgi:hypothetical protein